MFCGNTYGDADRLRRHGHHLYVTNLQGDIVGIVDESGSSVASYTYNAWGEIISSSGALAETNPLRYRGYYYDTETNLYYLQSRYYDPATCRFINADAFASTGQGFIGVNMFAYCCNKPVMLVDPSGHRFLEDWNQPENKPKEPSVVVEVINKVAWAGIMSIEAQVTFGVGLLIETEILGFGAAGGSVLNLLDVRFENGEFFAGSSYNDSLTIDLVTADIGWESDKFTSYDKRTIFTENFKESRGKLVWDIGAKGYLLIGGGFYVGFNWFDFFNYLSE